MMSLMAILMSAFAQGAIIATISNVHGSSAVIAVKDKGETKLVEFNLETAKKQTLALPSGYAGEDVLGLFSSKGGLLMLIQDTSGGDGRSPSLYVRAAGEWKKLTGPKCISFDDVRLEKGFMKLQCENNPYKKVAAHEEKVTVPDGFADEKVVLPRTENTAGKLSIKVDGGDLLAWETVKVKNAKGEKSYKASELLKK